MKKKRKIIGLFCVATLLLAGCNRERDLSGRRITEGESSGWEESVISESGETVKPDGENVTGIVSLGQTPIDISQINRRLEELNKKEKFLAVVPLDEERLLLQCMNREREEQVFYVLCVKGGEENIRTINLDLAGDVDCCTYEDCFVLYDTMNHVIVLDSELEICNEVLIPDSIHSMYTFMSVRNYCIFPREQKVLYYKSVLEKGELYVGLYETDYTCAESRLVYKLDGPETNLNFLNGFLEICPGYSQSGIFFTGDYFETADSQSKKCVGYLELVSGVSVVCKTNMLQMEVTADGCVFFDGYRESDKGYSGELLMIAESGAVSQMKTEYFKESERIGCDRQGRMLTCYDGDNGETVFNLYNGKVWEKQVVIPYSVNDFMLLDQGQCILCSFRSQDGLLISLHEI